MISPGAILIRTGTHLPASLGLENGAAGWASVANNLDSHEVDKALAAAGWTFFYMAGAIRRAAFGFSKQKIVDKALKRLLADVKLQKCNCLEIDDIATRSLLGIPYVSIAGHSRHIQEGMVFSGQ